jgi:hypothetical protein
MTSTVLKKKLLDLQAELELIQRMVDREPDWGTDEMSWRKVRSEAKKTRKRLYRRRYDKGGG